MENKAMDYIFYHVIGTHAGESIEKIEERKIKEIQDCGFCLWAAWIDEKSKLQAWALKETDEVYVLCRKSPDAKYNGDEIFTAKKMSSPLGVQDIPNGINVTYGGGKYQAYVVESYEILDEVLYFDFGQYEATSSKNEIKSFADRFRGKQFQNVFGRKNPSLKRSFTDRDISVIMKLKYPFVVDIS